MKKKNTNYYHLVGEIVNVDNTSPNYVTSSESPEQTSFSYATTSESPEQTTAPTSVKQRFSI